MPRQLGPIPSFDPSNRAKLNQILDDATARVDRGVISKKAQIRQGQLHQHKVSKFQLRANKSATIRHNLGALPSNVSFAVVEGAGTVSVVRMTADRIYVRATADVRVDVVIQR